MPTLIPRHFRALALARAGLLEGVDPNFFSETPRITLMAPHTLSGVRGRAQAPQDPPLLRDEDLYGLEVPPRGRPTLSPNHTPSGTRFNPTTPGQETQALPGPYITDEEERAIGEWLGHVEAGRIGGG